MVSLTRGNHGGASASLFGRVSHLNFHKHRLCSPQTRQHVQHASKCHFHHDAPCKRTHAMQRMDRQNAPVHFACKSPLSGTHSPACNLVKPHSAGRRGGMQVSTDVHQPPNAVTLAARVVHMGPCDCSFLPPRALLLLLPQPEQPEQPPLMHTSATHRQATAVPAVSVMQLFACLQPEVCSRRSCPSAAEKRHRHSPGGSSSNSYYPSSVVARFAQFL